MTAIAQPIIFFKKNKMDYNFTEVLLTASQGSAYAPFVQRRSNNLGWMTTGSVDADNTTLTCDFVNSTTLTDILLIGHNFKNYTIKYWNGSSYVNFGTTINVTNSTDTTTRHSFASVSTTKIQCTITGTQVANADKSLNQWIATETIGQLAGWPLIKKPTFNYNKRVDTMLSGKKFVGINTGGFACDLSVKVWSSSADLTIVESLFVTGSGFLVWLCGGSTSQFSSSRFGYRLQDLFLMQCQNNYIPEWNQGLYKSGIGDLTLSLVEVSS
jgi:hypothetical protein